MRPVVIVGAGGHGREAADIISDINDVTPSYQILGFADDGYEPGTKIHPNGLQVIGPVVLAADLDAMVVVALGRPASRRQCVSRLGSFEPVSLIHPAAFIGKSVSHGAGLIAAAGVHVTHAVDLGDHVHLNIGCSVSHDCTVGNFVTITPGARLSGNVTLEDDVWMGINSSVIQGVTVRRGVTVGAGAAVIGDLPMGCTAVGVPARVLPDE